MTENARRKQAAEMEIFLSFARAARLDFDPETAVNQEPPLPDIGCRIAGSEHHFELGELVDEDLARMLNDSPEASGWASEKEPLRRMIEKKGKKKYESRGMPIDLLFYCDKQSPAILPNFLKELELKIMEMEAAGPFRKIWFYNTWSRTILRG
jgi:hypothetical protein